MHLASHHSFMNDQLVLQRAISGTCPPCHCCDGLAHWTLPHTSTNAHYVSAPLISPPPHIPCSTPCRTRNSSPSLCTSSDVSSTRLRFYTAPAAPQPHTTPHAHARTHMHDATRTRTPHTSAHTAPKTQSSYPPASIDHLIATDSSRLTAQHSATSPMLRHTWGHLHHFPITPAAPPPTTVILHRTPPRPETKCTALQH